MCGRASATHRSVAGLLALLLVLLPFGRAEAASRKPTKERVLILRVESTQLDDDARRSLTDALADSAKRYKHYDLVLSKVDLVEEMFEFECTEAGVDCLSKIGRKHKVDKVIYSEVSKDGNGKLEWSMRVVGLKPVPRVEQSTRQQLEGADAAKLAERSLLVLIGPIDLPARGEASLGTLAVRLAGGGVALVYVDDNLLGRTSVGGLTAQMAARQASSTRRDLNWFRRVLRSLATPKTPGSPVICDSSCPSPTCAPTEAAASCAACR